MRNLLLISVLALGLNACSGHRPPSPEKYAADFWNAVIANDSDTASSLIDRDTGQLPQLDNSAHLLQGVEFGNTISFEDVRRVETVLLGEAKAGDEPQRLPLITLLVKDGDGWKIDLGSTLDHLHANMVWENMHRDIARLSAAGDGLHHSLHSGVDAYLHALNGKLPNLHESLKHLEDREQAEEIEARLGNIFSKALVNMNAELTMGMSELDAQLIAVVHELEELMGKQDH